MKLKNYVNLILALLMVLTLFSGCREETPQPSESVENDNTVSTQESRPNVEYPLPEETFHAVNGVYVTCENYDFTIYKGLSASCELHFMLMSEKPLPEGAQLVLTDVQTGYKVSFLRRTPENTLTGLDKVLYEYVQNPDFTADDYYAYFEERDRAYEEYERLYRIVYGADGKQPGEQYPEDHDYAKEFEKAKAAVEEIENRYQEAYDKFLSTETRPEYCLYDVVIFFKGAAAQEQIKTMELIAGDMSRTITMKNVWIKPFNSGELHTEKITSLRIATDPSTGEVVQAGFSERKGCNQTVISFVADEDIMLKNIYPYGDNTRITIEKTEVILFDKNGNKIHAEWIQGKDFLVRKGEQISICAYWKDPYADLVHYAMDAAIVVAYNCGDKLFQTWGNISFQREDIRFNAYRYYLMAFKGVDMNGLL